MSTKFDRVIADVPKECFTEYYFSHSSKETQEHFNIGSTVFARIRDYYGIKKPSNLINDVRCKTNIEKYGVQNIFQDVERIKNAYIEKDGSLENHYKKCANIQKESILEKYGNASGAYFAGDESRKRTCKKLYNTEYITQSNEFKKKSCDTKHTRYNDKNYHNIEQMRVTNLQKFGYEYNFASDDETINGGGTYHNMLKDPEYKKQITAKKSTTCKQRYGEDYYTEQVKKMIASIASKANSTYNTRFASFIMSYGIPFDREFSIGEYFYDFKLGKYLLEVNPYPTHNATWGIFGEPKAEDYHRKKTINALDNGYTCIHIFDWTNATDILYNIVNKQIDIVDTGSPKKYIFDTKLNTLVDTESENTVIIYDDGFEVHYKNGNEN